ncbi:quinone-dependent dihydroorotate dehydrogenase [Pseudonocardia sp. WMMC193]|uniref:quinone-dependent dihydroorotate dehydrogenase n=1 Tax=Pseudonocardia sp. WMMC193 TaxID=2911965 RepID=UPI001F015B76|nr:quinone-dependent dihydroorotate dehydrogenase [Pseudonocardia sp. WMMC193]MCF7551518.1 quinone-dependent dihydroorotate dehydrogenase [Pseudonocardia sp. WMMC193]
MYDLLFQHVLRRIPAEPIHGVAFGAIRGVAGSSLVGPRLSSVLTAPDPVLRTRVFGVDFPNPLGLAAGFDKDARGPVALGNLGFGFVEIGTVTARPQPGNPKPRLFRLPADKALVNRMGFNNSGADAVAAHLATLPERRPVLGINIGKSKAATPDEAVDDYRYSARALGRFADYVVVNVSSPNTPGLRDMQQVSVLEPLLGAVRDELVSAVPGRTVPLLVKITTDLAGEDVDAVADMSVRLGLDGVVATNTTVSREGLRTPRAEVDALGAGGVSGLPLREAAQAVVGTLRAKLGPERTIISVGGIFTGEDAYQRITAGASLVQSYTGFIYGGATWPKKVNQELAVLLHRNRHRSVAAAVGTT